MLLVRSRSIAHIIGILGGSNFIIRLVIYSDQISLYGPYVDCL